MKLGEGGGKDDNVLHKDKFHICRKLLALVLQFPVSGSINPFSRSLVTAMRDKNIPNPPSAANTAHFLVLHARVSYYSWPGGTTLKFVGARSYGKALHLFIHKIKT